METTIEKPTSTEMITFSSEDIALRAIGNNLILRMRDACDQCRAIIITDESTLKIGTEMLKTLNQTIKAIDEKRKAIKEPYFRTGKLIDAAANKLVEEAEKVIAEGKQKIVAFEKLAEEGAAKIRQEAAEKAALEQAEINRKAQEQQKILEAISDYEKIVIEAFVAANTIEALKGVYEKFIKLFPADSFFGDKLPEALAMKDRLIVFKNNRKKAITQAVAIAKQKGELSDLAKEKMALQAKLEGLNALESSMQSVEMAKEEVAEIAQKQTEQVKAAELSANLDAEISVDNMRESITYELVDFTKVPEEWKVLNDAKVKEFIKLHKKQITNGSISNGVMFKIERKPAL